MSSGTEETNKRRRSDAFRGESAASVPDAPVPDAPVPDAPSVVAAERSVYEVRVAIPRITFPDVDQRSGFGVSTRTSWRRIEQNDNPSTCDEIPYVTRPWREVPTVEYETFPLQEDDFGTLNKIVQDLMNRMMSEHLSLYNSFWVELISALEGKKELLPEYRRAIIKDPHSLAAFVATFNAIRPHGPPENDRFLPLAVDDDERNEKTLAMYLTMKELLNALENGVWGSSGTVPDMAQFIRDMETDVDPFQEAVQDQQPFAAGQVVSLDDMSSDEDTQEVE